MMPPELRDQVANKAPEARRKIEQVWGLLGRLERDALDAPPTEAAWTDLQQRLDASPSTTRAARRTPDRPPARQGRRRSGVGLSMVAGLVVVLDEVETVQRMNAPTREKSLNALRQLMDMLATDDLPGLYLVVTGTRDFFEGYKGLKGLQLRGGSGHTIVCSRDVQRARRSARHAVQRTRAAGAVGGRDAGDAGDRPGACDGSGRSGLHDDSFGGRAGGSRGRGRRCACAASDTRRTTEPGAGLAAAGLRCRR